MAKRFATGLPVSEAGFVTLQAGTPGTDARIESLGNRPSWPVLVWNIHATETLYVAINGLPATVNAPWKIGGLTPAAGTLTGPIDVSLGGRIRVEEVSFFYNNAAVAYTNAKLLAWPD